ncbi:MAG TPA: hypothetical protein PKD51_20010 [Saprospiraceae bacterium]|nr:hypothetical protein [Saprospiraceae bacterium]
MNTYVRRKSTPLDVAKTRSQGLMSQDPAMDLGNGLGVQPYLVEIAALEVQLLKVNNIAAEIQTERAKLRQLEREMRDLNDRYMKATAAKFGTSSYEYMAIGGVRKNERRRPTFSATPSPSTDEQ